MDKADMHYENACIRLDRINKALPSGSGFDNGTSIESVTDQKIVFSTSFHHINENGFYDGWTNHRVTVSASLTFGFVINVSGKNKNEIKDYISDIFNVTLESDFNWIN